MHDPRCVTLGFAPSSRLAEAGSTAVALGFLLNPLQHRRAHCCLRIVFDRPSSRYSLLLCAGNAGVGSTPLLQLLEDSGLCGLTLRICLQRTTGCPHEQMRKARPRSAAGLGTLSHRCSVLRSRTVRDPCTRSVPALLCLRKSCSLSRVTRASLWHFRSEDLHLCGTYRPFAFCACSVV